MYVFYKLCLKVECCLYWMRGRRTTFVVVVTRWYLVMDPVVFIYLQTFSSICRKYTYYRSQMDVLLSTNNKSSFYVSMDRDTVSWITSNILMQDGLAIRGSSTAPLQRGGRRGPLPSRWREAKQFRDSSGHSTRRSAFGDVSRCWCLFVSREVENLDFWEFRIRQWLVHNSVHSKNCKHPQVDGFDPRFAQCRN